MATIVAAEVWPEVLERERAYSWIPDFGNEAGPPGLDGTRQYRNTNGGGLWRCSFNGVHLSGREHVLAWMAAEVLLRGGMTPVDIPMCGYRPTVVGGGAGTVDVRSVGGWAARATSGRIELVDSTELLAGMHFSDYDAATYGYRLHRIASIAVVGSGSSGPNERDITFWPPARFAVADGNQMRFSNPRCVMRLAATDSMDVDLELRKRGAPNAEFVEAF